MKNKKQNNQRINVKGLSKCVRFNFKVGANREGELELSWYEFAALLDKMHAVMDKEFPTLDPCADNQLANVVVLEIHEKVEKDKKLLKKLKNTEHIGASKLIESHRYTKTLSGEEKEEFMQMVFEVMEENPFFRKLLLPEPTPNTKG